MKIRPSGLLASLVAGLALAATSAQAALPTGSDLIGPAIITDMGVAAGYGASVMVVALGLSIGFDLVKKFIKKGAK